MKHDTPGSREGGVCHQGRPRQVFLTMVAQDPAFKENGSMLKVRVPVMAEDLADGPCGHRVQVVDYDATSGVLYKALKCTPDADGRTPDAFDGKPDAEILANPQVHAQNVYVIVMRVLARFEQALGRRVSWSFWRHQLKVAPHAFAEANAYYSKDDEALFFGYFTGRDGRTIFSALSHDVVAHETTHALLDGLRARYTDPSSPDQAAFHEGFADVVALLSVFSLPRVVEVVLGKDGRREKSPDSVSESELKPPALRRSALLGLAEQMGGEMSGARGQPLRRSAEIEPSPGLYDAEEFQEPHRRGELLVAAVLNAFISVWSDRAIKLRSEAKGRLDLARVAEEGREAADRLLTMCIRALDYCPPVHLVFGDYLSALLTSDAELHPDDQKYGFRDRLRESFAAYGIHPAAPEADRVERGRWHRPENEGRRQPLNYERTHFEPMQRDPDEVFHFIWENRRTLGLYEGAFTQVMSVRPCLRISTDGFALRETVAEYIQILTVKASELAGLGIKNLPDEQWLPRSGKLDATVRLYGGGVLVFDEYGRLKFHVHNHLDNWKKQAARLRHLAASGYFLPASGRGRFFARMHLCRALDVPLQNMEGWVTTPGQCAHDHDDDLPHAAADNHADDHDET